MARKTPGPIFSGSHVFSQKTILSIAVVGYADMLFNKYFSIFEDIFTIICLIVENLILIHIKIHTLSDVQNYVLFMF